MEDHTQWSRSSLQIKFAVAAAVRHVDRKWLVVRRPDDDASLAGMWGLPAVSLTAGELPIDAVRRIGRTKLATELEAKRTIGIDSADRADYQLILMDVECQVVGGAPNVQAAAGTGTLYVESRWVDDLSILIPSAEQGSLCCQILLRAHAVTP